MSNELYYRGSGTYESAVQNQLARMEQAGVKNAAVISNSIRDMTNGLRSEIVNGTYAVITAQEYSTRRIEAGIASLGNSINFNFQKLGSQLNSIGDTLGKMGDRLDDVHDIVNNPLLTANRELYRRSITNFDKGYYVEALEDAKAAIEKYKTDYASWFLLGQIYLYGAGKYGNVINLQESITAFENAAKYIDADLGQDCGAESIASQIFYYLGEAKYLRSNDLLLEGKEEESNNLLESAETNFHTAEKFCDLTVKFDIVEYERIDDVEGYKIDLKKSGDIWDSVLEINECIELANDKVSSIENAIAEIEEYDDISSDSANRTIQLLSERMDNIHLSEITDSFTIFTHYLNCLKKRILLQHYLGNDEEALKIADVAILKDPRFFDILSDEKGLEQLKDQFKVKAEKQLKNNIDKILCNTNEQLGLIENAKSSSSFEGLYKEDLISHIESLKNMKSVAENADLFSSSYYYLLSKKNGEIIKYLTNHIKQVSNDYAKDIGIFFDIAKSFCKLNNFVLSKTLVLSNDMDVYNRVQYPVLIALQSRGAGVYAIHFPSIENDDNTYFTISLETTLFVHSIKEHPNVTGNIETDSGAYMLADVINAFKKYAEEHDDKIVQAAIDELNKKIESLPNESMKRSSKGCYVATSIYGSYDCPQVWTLRRFRDNTLGSTWYGRLFIKTYYAVSPTLVKCFGKTKWFKNMWKPVLDKMVSKLNLKGVENTPYDDKIWR